jgi:hypothetical protein
MRLALRRQCAVNAEHWVALEGSGAYGTGSRYDTSPQKGCCTATLVAVGEPEGNQRLTKSAALWSAGSSYMRTC